MTNILEHVHNHYKFSIKREKTRAGENFTFPCNISPVIMLIEKIAVYLLN